VRLADAVAAACAGTVAYAPDDLDRLLADVTPGAAATHIEVTGESSISAARRLYDCDENRAAAGSAERIAVLNFASARNPGGGYLGGARAQEEDLCRISALYTTLLQAPDHYAAHRASKDPAYSHRVIYSPDVPVYRDVEYRLLEAPYPLAFLTSPAPNAGVIARDHPSEVAALPDLLAARAARVLAVAARYGRRTLVLGAWGCSVFRNDPAGPRSSRIPAEPERRRPFRRRLRPHRVRRTGQDIRRHIRRPEPLRVPRRFRLSGPDQAVLTEAGRRASGVVGVR
jgi:uncharacterized protein (TIGR02452 family)